MISKLQFAGIALCAAATSVVAGPCKQLGVLDQQNSAAFGGSFSKSGTYVDCFKFSLNGAGDLQGNVSEHDPAGNRLKIDVTSIELFTGNGKKALQVDSSPKGFSFGGLIGGVVYTLQVASTVTGGGDSSKNSRGSRPVVGYMGRAVQVASAAPEPSAYVLALAGLAVVGAGVLRSRKR